MVIIMVTTTVTMIIMVIMVTTTVTQSNIAVGFTAGEQHHMMSIIFQKI